MRRFVLLTIAVIFLIIVGNAVADWTPDMLPTSSHYQGRSYHTVNTDSGLISGRVEFAVYDTVTYENEFIGTDGWTNPGDGQFIYAYQIYQDSSSGTSIDFFSILGIDGDEVLSGIETIGFQDPNQGQDSIEPLDAYPNFDETLGIWVFENGMLIANEQSYFLVFSSNHDWVTGTYTFEAPPGEVPIPSESPEPSTALLLGIGGIAFLRRRLRS